jgi:hypothetical protein
LSSPKWRHGDTVLATSVDVERTFSKGRVILSYLRNRLQVDTTRALLCLGDWISKGWVKDSDILAGVKGVPDVDVEDFEDDDLDFIFT